MSETKKIDLNSLYSTLIREIENDTVQEIDSQFYLTLSEYLGKLKSEAYDGIENKIKNRLVEMITQIISLLLKTRISKVSHGGLNLNNLLDEEKFIIELLQDQQERKEMILSATLNGRTKLLESVSKKHKIKPIAVRFLKDFDQFVGADLTKYGPFKTEEIATIPNENAQALIAKNIAVKLSVQD
ncbi:MAG: DNA replication complex subunit Gins51 [Candidatus Nitrosotenuis sp.]